MLFYSLLVGVLDGIGLALFIPLLQSTEGMATGGADMGKLQILVDAIEGMGLSITLNTVLVLMLALFLLKGVLKFWEKYYNAKVRQFFLKRIRYELVDGLSNMRFMHFTTSDSGRIQNILTGEVQRVMSAFNQYFQTAQGIVLIIVYIVLAFLANWQFALLVLAAGLLTNFIYQIFYKLTKKWSAKVSSEGHLFQGFIIQSVNYFKYLKATNGIRKYSDKLKEKINKIEDANLQMGKIGAILMGSREAITIGILLSVILIQLNLFGGTVSAMVLSLLFFYRAMSSIMNVQNSWNTFLTNSGALDSVQDFIVELKKNKQRLGTGTIGSALSKIEVKDLIFKYGDRAILNKLSFTVNANETVAIVGESGSGKTTLVNLLAGLLDQFEGEVCINGVNLKELDTQEWQQHIGYITQEPVIFDDTIANNISLWDNLSIADNKQRFDSALKKAAIYDFIQSLAEKENAPLGNNGIMVSGGQKQRISIARELYKEVDLLILDEATSALDSETEKVIQEQLESLQGSYTMLIIAHRLSTIKNADKIVVLDKGKIEAMGSFNQLVQDSPRFKKMVELQEF